MRIAAQALAVALVAALLGLLGWKLATQAGDDAATLLERGERPVAPAFTLPRLDGRGDFRSASLEGKFVVVNFWATWCYPCTKEAPILAAAHRRWSKRGVVFLGVDVRDFSSDARRFAKEKRLSYVHVRDRAGTLADRYGAFRLPETFFIRRDGRIVARIAGELSEDELNDTIARVVES